MWKVDASIKLDVPWCVLTDVEPCRAPLYLLPCTATWRCITILSWKPASSLSKPAPPLSKSRSQHLYEYMNKYVWWRVQLSLDVCYIIVERTQRECEPRFSGNSPAIWHLVYFHKSPCFLNVCTTFRIKWLIILLHDSIVSAQEQLWQFEHITFKE